MNTFNCFHNACIAYRIILTIHIIMKSIERSFKIDFFFLQKQNDIHLFKLIILQIQ